MIAQTEQKEECSSNLNPQRESVEELNLQVLVEQKIISDMFGSVMKTPNKIAIAVSFIPPTNVKGSRVKVQIPRMHTKKFFSFCHEFNSVSDQIEKLLADNDIWPVCQGEFNDSTFFMVDFEEWNKLREIFG